MIPRRLVVLSGASALQAASNAVAGLLATVVLGPQDRGLMVLGLTIGSVCGLVGGFGSGAAFRARLPAAAEPAGRRSLVSTYTWCSLGGMVLAVFVAVMATAASAPLIDSALRSPGFLLATASYTVGQTLLTQVPDGWFADGQFRRGGVGAAAMCAGGLVGVATALTVSRSAGVVLAAQALGIVLVGLGQVVALRRVGLAGLFRPDPELIKSLLRQGAPALGLTFGLAVAMRADRYFLGVATSPATVGVYSLAVSLAELSRLVPAAAGQLFLRDTATGLGANRLGPTIRFAVGAAVVGGVLAVGIGWPLIVPIFGPEFAAAGMLLALLALAEVCLAPFSVASRGLLGGGWTGTAGTVGGVGGLVALAVYAVAATSAGPVGVAIGSVLVYAGLSLAAGTLLRTRVRRAATERN
jgi:O-antigen/teichoic acid export membrane protein